MKHILWVTTQTQLFLTPPQKMYESRVLDYDLVRQVQLRESSLLLSLSTTRRIHPYLPNEAYLPLIN